MPGTDPAEAAATVFGELPGLPHLPELPARGLGADLIGRTAALLVDLPFELVPSGYRVTAHPSADQRRATELLCRDLDALQEVADRTGGGPNAVKVQVAGPWTLTADIELIRGHRVLTDQGALREFSQSLAEGLAVHIAEVGARTGAPVLVQLDEPTLPAVLAGRLRTPSGFGMVPAVGTHEAVELLNTVIEAAREASGRDVIVHCCAPNVPLGLLREAGATAISLDATLLADAGSDMLDAIGEAWDAGTMCCSASSRAPTRPARRPCARSPSPRRPARPPRLRPHPARRPRHPHSHLRPGRSQPGMGPPSPDRLTRELGRGVTGTTRVLGGSVVVNVARLLAFWVCAQPASTARRRQPRP